MTTSSFALTLEQVKSELSKTIFPKDSIEIRMETLVEVPNVSTQSMKIYLVQKGTSKIYMELKSSLLNQRSIINGSRMKIIDLKTKESQIVPYNGDALQELKPLENLNPLESGNWKEPKYVSANLYSIVGDSTVLFYNSKKKRIEKAETKTSESFVTTTFEYNADNSLKVMLMEVNAGGVFSKITNTFSIFRHSKKFPDKLFEF